MTYPALKLQGPGEVCRKFKIPDLSDSADGDHVEQALEYLSERLRLSLFEPAEVIR